MPNNKKQNPTISNNNLFNLLTEESKNRINELLEKDGYVFNQKKKRYKELYQLSGKMKGGKAKKETRITNEKVVKITNQNTESLVIRYATLADILEKERYLESTEFEPFKKEILSALNKIQHETTQKTTQDEVNTRRAIEQEEQKEFNKIREVALSVGVGIGKQLHREKVQEHKAKDTLPLALVLFTHGTTMVSGIRTIFKAGYVGMTTSILGAASVLQDTAKLISNVTPQKLKDQLPDTRLPSLSDDTKTQVASTINWGMPILTLGAGAVTLNPYLFTISVIQIATPLILNAGLKTIDDKALIPILDSVYKKLGITSIETKEKTSAIFSSMLQALVYYTAHKHVIQPVISDLSIKAQQFERNGIKHNIQTLEVIAEDEVSRFVITNKDGSQQVVYFDKQLQQSLPIVVGSTDVQSSGPSVDTTRSDQGTVFQISNHETTFNFFIRHNKLHAADPAAQAYLTQHQGSILATINKNREALTRILYESFTNPLLMKKLDQASKVTLKTLFETEDYKELTYFETLIQVLSDTISAFKETIPEVIVDQVNQISATIQDIIHNLKALPEDDRIEFEDEITQINNTMKLKTTPTTNKAYYALFGVAINSLVAIATRIDNRIKFPVAGASKPKSGAKSKEKLGFGKVRIEEDFVDFWQAAEKVNLKVIKEWLSEIKTKKDVYYFLSGIDYENKLTVLNVAANQGKDIVIQEIMSRLSILLRDNKITYEHFADILMQKSGADITVLHTAAEQGDDKVINEIISSLSQLLSGGYITQENFTAILMQTSGVGNSMILNYAACKGKVKVFHVIISNLSQLLHDGKMSKENVEMVIKQKNTPYLLTNNYLVISGDFYSLRLLKESNVNTSISPLPYGFMSSISKESVLYADVMASQYDLEIAYELAPDQKQDITNLPLTKEPIIVTVNKIGSKKISKTIVGDTLTLYSINGFKATSIDHFKSTLQMAKINEVFLYSNLSKT